ncbi:MAG: P1 family peptidase [bacterium]
MSYPSITDLPGIRVGHVTDEKALTGCTVVLCEEGAVAGIDVRGSAPGTRETDCLRPVHLVQRVHAVLLAGGSAFGLAAADGVMRYLEEKGVGYRIRTVCVPVVPAAVIFDLSVGDGSVRPDREMGYQACLAATGGEVPVGSVGAGTGATVGKILGYENCMRGGVGTYSKSFDDGVVVGALTVVNALGDVVDPQTGEIVAGARDRETGTFLDTVKVMVEQYDQTILAGMNTTLSVVATNAALTKEQTNKVAQMAHNGLARAIRPCHTMVDGDTIFALSLGSQKADPSVIGSVAADVVAGSVLQAVTEANMEN